MSEDEERQSERPAAPKAAKKKPTAKKKSAKSAAAPAPIPRKLGEEEIAAARAAGRPWQKSTRFAAGDYFVHSAFGVGLVVEVQMDVILCLFEDGVTRRLIHGR